MNRIVLVTLMLLLFQSCIPLRIAPDIDDYKVTKGKKFKRSLPKRHMFVFEDTKDADQFYQYVNIKFALNDENVFDDIPFRLKGAQYFFSFYEVEIPDKTLNLFPVLFSATLNAALGNEDEDISEPTEIRRDNFYIAIEVYSDLENDCLGIESLSREAVLKYLRTLKNEYLTTHNYNEVVFKN
ncbi:hypothetical protein [Maribacter halichondriae]|uniref:hypothetical protein n=1 Tax=Maribacter halichondriae TaxID=2980554 RepID=UPI0023599D7D|nr:hypothetical protein [Maribacter sp. Hal144]